MLDMQKESVTVNRGHKPAWGFSWDDEYSGLVHKTRLNVYKLFFENPAYTCKPIWIGRLVGEGEAWVTFEKEIGAKYIEFCGAKVLFET